MRNQIFNLTQYVCSALLFRGILLITAASANAQTQVPATAPQVREVLTSYEGQTVVSIEIAGRPDLDQQRLQPLLIQQAGQPFARAKIDQSISALKSSGKVQEV